MIIDDELYLFKDFNIKIQTNNVKITNKLTEDISDKYVANLRKIIELNKIVFKQKLKEFEKKYSVLLDELVSFIAEIDVTVSNIKVSKKYNFIIEKFKEPPKPPSEKQLNFAKQLAEENGVEIPEKALKSSSELSKWIDKMLKKPLFGFKE